MKKLLFVVILILVMGVVFGEEGEKPGKSGLYVGIGYGPELSGVGASLNLYSQFGFLGFSVSVGAGYMPFTETIYEGTSRSEDNFWLFGYAYGGRLYFGETHRLVLSATWTSLDGEDRYGEIIMKSAGLGYQYVGKDGFTITIVPGISEYTMGRSQRADPTITFTLGG